MPRVKAVKSPEKTELLEQQSKQILTIFPKIREIYFSLQRLGNIDGNFWVGEADFKKFIGLQSGKSGVSDVTTSEALLKKQLEADIANAFVKYIKKFNKLKKAYLDRARESLTVLSVSFTPFEINRTYIDLEARISRARIRINTIDIKDSNSLESLHEEIKSIICDFDVLSDSMWKKVNEFEKFKQDKLRYFAAILSSANIVVGLLVALVGFLIANALNIDAVISFKNFIGGLLVALVGLIITNAQN